MSQVGTANLGGFAARHEDTDPAGKLRKYDIFWLMQGLMQGSM